MADSPSTPELALRDAILTRLRADGAFYAIAGKQLFDEVPSSLGSAAPSVKPPYAYFGPMRRTSFQNTCALIWTIQARLYAVSTAYNRDQGWLLIDAMIASLNELEAADLPLAEPYSLYSPLVVGQAGDVIDPLQAKSVFFDLTTSIARPLPSSED